MNLKNMTIREITQMVSTLNHPEDIEEAVDKLSGLIESLKILRSMLEGRKLIQVQQNQIKRRKGLQVVKKEKE